MSAVLRREGVTCGDARGGYVAYSEDDSVRAWSWPGCVRQRAGGSCFAGIS
jgi:hypothetical protein